MRLLKYKSGSQVGFTLSFIIFVIFVFFLFIIVKPSLKTGNSENLPQNTLNKVEAMTLANLTTVSISLDKTAHTCVEIVDFFGNTGAGIRLAGKDEQGNTVTLTRATDGNNLYVQKDASDFFIKIYSSSEFDQTGTGTLGSCPQVSEGSGYSVGLVKTEKVVFASKITDLFSNYSADYDNLKNFLGVPSGNDFGVSFRYGNGTVVSTPNPNSNVNIYAYEIPVQYLNQNNNIDSGFLNVRTW